MHTMPDAPSAARQRYSGARLANLIGALALGITDSAHDAVTSVTDLDDVTATALIALLDFAPGGSVRMLSQVVGLTHSGAVRLVDRLVDADLVTRDRGGDSRSRAIRLTSGGRRTALRARAARQAALGGIVEQLSNSDRATLTRLCERTIATITRQRLAQRAAQRPPSRGALCRVCDFAACGRSQGICPAATTAAVGAYDGRDAQPRRPS